MALLLAGGRALLMQIAHPKVAAGVAEHSHFQDDPLARLHRTMGAMWSIVFDEQAQARAALERVASRHEKVYGIVPDVELGHAGVRYDAFDQDLLLWVHATLMDSAMVAYSFFVAPLAEAQATAYYQDSKKLAALFGIKDELIPDSPGEFNAYMDSMISGDVITVGPTARKLAQDILYPRQWIFRPGGPLFRLVTAGLLPEKLRDGYALNWSVRKEKCLVSFAGAVRAALPFVPARIRIVPNARVAEKIIRS